MKLSVVTDSQGNILSLFPAPPETQEESAPQSGGQKKGKLSYAPKSDERVHVLEVPPSFHGRPLLDMHTGLRVEMHGSTAMLVEVEAD